MKGETWLGLLFLFVFGCSDLKAQRWSPKPTPSTIASRSDSQEFVLARLKARDSQFDRRTLVIERHWIEEVDPFTQQMAMEFANLKGGDRNAPPRKDPLPPKHNQPHRITTHLTTRGDDITIRLVRENEKILHPEFGRGANIGLIWSRCGDETIAVDKYTIHRRSNSLLPMYARSYQWSMGYGYGQRMTEVTGVKMDRDRTVVTGKMDLVAGLDTGCTLHLDDDWIVRKAVISIASASGGLDQYVVVTKGKQVLKNAPLVAETGQYRRIARPVNKPFRITDDYHVDFVSLTDKQTEAEYDKEVTRAIKIAVDKLEKR